MEDNESISYQTHPTKDIYQIPLQDSALEGLVENVFPVPALQEEYFALPPVAANQKEHLFAVCLEQISGATEQGPKTDD